MHRFAVGCRGPSSFNGKSTAGNGRSIVVSSLRRLACDPPTKPRGCNPTPGARLPQTHTMSCVGRFERRQRQRCCPAIASSALRPKRSSIRPFTISTDSTNSAAASARSAAKAGGARPRGGVPSRLNASRPAVEIGSRAHDAGRDLRPDGVGAIGRDRERAHQDRSRRCTTSSSTVAKPGARASPSAAKEKAPHFA